MIGFDDGLDLLRRACEVGGSDPIGRLEDHDRLHIRRQGGFVDVVHPFQFQRMVVVDLEDHFPGAVDEDLVVPDRRGGDELAVLGDAGHLDDSGIEVSEESAPDILGDRPEVEVEIFHLAEIDLLPRDRVGVVRHAQLDPVHHRQRPVELAAGGGTGHDDNAELPPFAVLPQDMLGERLRNQLRIPRPGESAHAHLVAALDQLGRVGRVRDFFPQIPVVNSQTSHRAVPPSHDECVTRQSLSSRCP